MALHESWHIRSRSRECSASGQAFADGEPIVTALFPDPESSGYLRQDFTPDAWKARPADAEAPFSFWRGRYQAPAASEKSEAIERESAEDLFRRLLEEDEDHTENTRYILAVMLERRKILRETDNQRTPNGILRVYEQRKSGEVFIVRDPDIPLSEVERVQTEVFELLESGGRRPGAAPESTGDSETAEGAVEHEAAGSLETAENPEITNEEDPEGDLESSEGAKEGEELSDAKEGGETGDPAADEEDAR